MFVVEAGDPMIQLTSLTTLSMRWLWLIVGMSMLSLVAAESLTLDQALLRAQQVNENAAVARERINSVRALADSNSLRVTVLRSTNPA